MGFSERVCNYPQCAPQTALDLLQLEFDELAGLECSEVERQAVAELRRDLIDAAHAWARSPITGPSVVAEMISGRHPLLRPLNGRWLSYVLDRERDRVLVPKSGGQGGYKYLVVVTAAAPTAAELRRWGPLPTGGTYLLLYGGGPEVLAVNNTAAALWQLQQEVPVADVCFATKRASTEQQSAAPSALFSLRKGAGDCAGEPIAFPDEALLKEAQAW